jgi:hypothetical protein
VTYQLELLTSILVDDRFSLRDRLFFVPIRRNERFIRRESVMDIDKLPLYHQRCVLLHGPGGVG